MTEDEEKKFREERLRFRQEQNVSWEQYKDRTQEQNVSWEQYREHMRDKGYERANRGTKASDSPQDDR
jgi:hypothetical protein